MKYVFGIVVIAAVIAGGLRIYGPYHDSAEFKGFLSDAAIGALEKNDAVLRGEIASRAASLGLTVPPGGITIDRSPDNHSIGIHVVYGGVVDMFLYRYPVDFSAETRRDLSYPAEMIQRSRERVEKSLQGYDASIEENSR